MRETVTRTRHQDGSYSVEAWRENGEIECPRCKEWQVLLEDVDEYEPGTGHVVGWGPGIAQCCGVVLFVYWDGAFAFELHEEVEP